MLIGSVAITFGQRTESLDEWERGLAYLLETDGSRLLAEALAAEVKAVLADETGLVGAEAAARQGTVSTMRTRHCLGPPIPVLPSFALPHSNQLSAFCLSTYPP